MSPELSIVIPAFNRVDLLQYTLQSVAKAIQNLTVEVILVDDGSEPELEPQLSNWNHLPIRFIRQNNQGLVFAKNAGLKLATGEFTLFLDSDDLVHENKFLEQVSAMRANSSDVSYTDVTTTQLDRPYEDLSFGKIEIVPQTTNAAELYLKIQPPPHSPLYRTEYLKKALQTPRIKALPIYNPIGEVWMYYNLACSPARVVKVDGPLTIVSAHSENRITQHWERLGVASLALMRALHEECRTHSFDSEVQALLGESAFRTWRRLPRRFHAAFEEELLRIWRESPTVPISSLGGEKFQLLAKYIGIEQAAKILRFVQRPLYSKIQTIPRKELEELFQHSQTN